jgi:hypothetical protein
MLKIYNAYLAEIFQNNVDLLCLKYYYVLQQNTGKINNGVANQALIIAVTPCNGLRTSNPDKGKEETPAGRVNKLKEKMLKL